jgi:hypothetical protein
MEKTIRELHSKAGCWGIMGAEIGMRDIKVGDLVAYQFRNDDKGVYRGIVVKDKDFYSVMGSIGVNIFNHVRVTKIISHELLTDEIIKSVNSNLSIIERKPVPLTVEQIEAILGYPVEIVEGC